MICLVLLCVLDHLKFCVVCINGRRYVCCSECNVVFDECHEPTSCLVQPIGTHGGEVMYFGCFCIGENLVDLPYDEISLTLTAGSVSLCCVCSHVVVFGPSVKLSWYPMWMRWLL